LRKIRRIKLLYSQISDAEAKRVIDLQDQVDSDKELEEILEGKWKDTENSDNTDAFNSILDKIHRKMNRVVSLNWEVFFEINPNSPRPFQVEMGQLFTKALGKTFNVFSKNENTAIALKERKVSVKKYYGDQKNEVLLFQEKMVFIAIDQKNSMVKNVDPQSVIVWKEGRIRFRSNSLETIMVDLQIWFESSLEFRGNINRKRNVPGVFDNEILKNILEKLC